MTAQLEIPAQRTALRPSTKQFGFDVAIVGLGYVGLPTALAFHAAGLRVLGVDTSLRRLNDIRAGSVDLGVSDLARLADATTSDRLLLDDTPAYLHDAAALIICVPTPIDAHQVPDLRLLREACRMVVANAVPAQTVILTSTSYVGTTRELLGEPLRQRGLQAGKDVFVGFSPERINPGSGGISHEEVPRVVGGLSPACTERVRTVLAGYNDRLHLVSSAEAAEFTKLYENTFRAVNIAYANEMSTAARSLGLDIGEILAAAATKPYGFMRFLPGPGVGGHCIPCDPHYLLWQMHTHRLTLPLVTQAMTSIERRPLEVVARIAEVLAADGKVLAGAEIVVCGVAYKPDVEDVRESPALVIIEELRTAGADVSYVDPYVPEIRLRDGETIRASAPTGGSSPDLVLLHTSHTGTDLGWLAPDVLVLDATYQAVSARARQVIL